MSVVGIIEPRYGATVHIGQEFHICITQHVDSGPNGAVILSRDEARQMIRLLQAAIEKSEQMEHEQAQG
ncbi:hypothetical protein NRB16_07925 [Pseudomonas sp. LJDD11]|uniref:hypothetical protein n=1 Tax=Pseudomonas sp. LJDD11 TaxID=2931984 RepID=UPI00211C1A28|nr:hypothetical protein [Pseudomonas sp. LJDD11]MCQ9423447.1 hypothetical protein [Pseudomonas sp. LJDD11]